MYIFAESEDEDKYLPVNDDPMSNLILEAIKNDDLRKVGWSFKRRICSVLPQSIQTLEKKLKLFGFEKWIYFL